MSNCLFWKFKSPTEVSYTFWIPPERGLGLLTAGCFCHITLVFDHLVLKKRSPQLHHVFTFRWLVMGVCLHWIRVLQGYFYPTCWEHCHHLWTASKQRIPFCGWTCFNLNLCTLETWHREEKSFKWSVCLPLSPLTCGTHLWAIRWALFRVVTALICLVLGWLDVKLIAWFNPHTNLCHCFYIDFELLIQNVG